MTQALPTTFGYLVQVTTASPLLAVLVSVLCLAVLVFFSCLLGLFVVGVFDHARKRMERKTQVDNAITGLGITLSTLTHDLADVREQLGHVSGSIAGIQQPSAPQQQQHQVGMPRFFYLGYVIVIDHDRNAEEFGIPGLEIIKRGTVTRPGMMVMASGDGIFNPAVLRLFLMRRFADSNMLPTGLPADTIVEHFRGPDDAPTIGSDGESTYGDVLDVVINCIHELTEMEFRAHVAFIEQMRIHGSNNNRNNE
jgi:hypothetical protein